MWVGVGSVVLLVLLGWWFVWRPTRRYIRAKRATTWPDPFAVIRSWVADEEEDDPPQQDAEFWEIPNETTKNSEGWQRTRYEHSDKDCTAGPFCMCSCAPCLKNHNGKVRGS